MPKETVVQTLNAWKAGKPLKQAVTESGIGKDDLANLLRDTMAQIRERVKDNARPRTNAEWAIGVNRRLEAVEAQIARQTMEFNRLLEALNQFIELCHPGRFGEGLRVVRPEAAPAEKGIRIGHDIPAIHNPANNNE